MILKRCKNIGCGKYFPSKLGTFISVCPDCIANPPPPLYNSYIQMIYDNIKSSRSVTIDQFDVYDSDYSLPGGGKERVCRLCGARLLRKDGKYSHQKRFCNVCRTKTATFYTEYLWGVVRAAVLKENQDYYKDLITEYREKTGKSIHCNIYICEQCHKITSYHEVQVHHIKPVHTLSNEEINLIWDKSNLIVLCTDCHHQQDHQLTRKKELPILSIQKDPHQKKLDIFFQKI